MSAHLEIRVSSAQLATRLTLWLAPVWVAAGFAYYLEAPPQYQDMVFMTGPAVVGLFWLLFRAWPGLARVIVLDSGTLRLQSGFGGVRASFPVAEATFEILYNRRAWADEARWFPVVRVTHGSTRPLLLTSDRSVSHVRDDTSRAVRRGGIVVEDKSWNELFEALQLEWPPRDE